jgi:hypothetical protein
VAKKSRASRKPARAKKVSAKGSKPKSSASRLDTRPLQAHLKKRIKQLEGKGPRAAAAGSGEDTLARLKQTLATLQDICFPSMTIPI